MLAVVCSIGALALVAVALAAMAGGGLPEGAPRGGPDRRRGLGLLWARLRGIVRRRRVRWSALAELGDLARRDEPTSRILRGAETLVGTATASDVCVLLELAGEDGRPRLRRVEDPGAIEPVPASLLAPDAPVLFDDAQAAEDAELRSWARASGIASVAAVPVHGREAPFGVLFAGRRRVDPFRPDELGFLHAAAETLGAAVARRQTELAERRLVSALESTPDLVAVLAPDERLLYLNRSGSVLLGLADDVDLPGTSLADLLSPAALALVRDEALPEATREGSWSGETRFLRPDGEEVPLWIALVAHETRDGTIDFYSMIARDITERQRLEAQLRHAQKMEAIGRLAGGVAHDFNNVLTAIMGYGELLHQRLLGQETLRRDVERIQGMAQRAASLTRQLLAFSRRQVLQPQVLNLNEVVASLDEMLRRLIGEDIELVTALAPSLGNVRADPAQLEQVLMNLAVNARDAMPRGGKLIIETANADLDERYVRRHLGARAGPHVLVAVTDTGVGMAESTLARIFEPFYTTKERGKGTGLGLSTVYGIVKQSGGNIWVYSEPGRGTTFKVYLPRAEAKAEPLRGEADAGAARGGVETLLLVEDEPQVRDLLERVLVEQGYTVLAAKDGVEALERARRHEGAIDLLLADVVMPKMSGRELAERLHEERPGVRVLYLSGYTDNAIVHHGVLDPGTPFLQKPFSARLLAAKVREVLDGPAPGAS